MFSMHSVAYVMYRQLLSWLICVVHFVGSLMYAQLPADFFLTTAEKAVCVCVSAEEEETRGGQKQEMWGGGDKVL